MSFPTRPLGRSLAVVALVVATLLVGITPAGVGPVRAINRSVPVRASDAAAPGGRLIVFWKTSRKPNLALPLVASARSSSAGSRRSVVVAAPGQAAALAASLRVNPDVAAVVPDVIVHASDWPVDGVPNDPGYAGNQTDLPLIGMPTAWQTTTGAPTVVVAILDTGTSAGHPDLLGTTFVTGFNTLDGTANVIDDNGHGTHLTGTIAAQTGNGIGVAGMAPRVSIMPIKVLDSQGDGSMANVLDGIDFARSNGANVINMSFGGPRPADPAPFQAGIDAAYAAGITLVAAAGNDYNSAVEYPCAFDHVICVGATDNADGHAAFSNANASVDVSAPGVGIWSTVPPNGYAALSGTSMATPHVAALAALVRSAKPSDNVDEVEAAILSTAVDLGAPGRDDVFGAGRIDAADAVSLAPPDIIPPTMVGLTAPGLVTSADRAFSVSFAATDNVAVAGFEVRTRKGATGAWSAASRQTATSRTFAGLGAGSWYVGVRAVDAAGRRSAWSQVLAIVPRDDRSWSFTSGTARRTGSGFVARTDTTTSRRGARMTIRFTGSGFYLIGTTAVRHGKLRITIDGRSWTVDEGRYMGARAKTTTKRVVLFSRSLAYRSHVAVITCLATPGRAVIDVDAVAWRN